MRYCALGNLANLGREHVVSEIQWDLGNYTHIHYYILNSGQRIYFLSSNLVASNLFILNKTSVGISMINTLYTSNPSPQAVWVYMTSPSLLI